MKKIFSALLISCAVLSGCTAGKNQTTLFRNDSSVGSINYENKKNDSSSFAEKEVSADNITDGSAAKSDSSIYQSEENADEAKKKDTYFNEDIDEAVENGKTEKADIDNLKSITVREIDKTYSSELLNESFEKLNEIISNAKFKLSFSYKNMEGNEQIEYNQNADYATCSCIKAPYVKSLLEQDIDLDKKVPLYYKWEGDYGYMSQQKSGSVFTVKDLIDYTILESDNTAYYQLVKSFGYNSFNSNQYKLGSDYYLGDSWIFTYASTNDMLKNFEDIYDFAEENKNGKWLVELMANASENIQIGAKLGNNYTVAQKYGADSESECFHDCAICYADSPFVLCIMTEGQIPETEESCKVFKELAAVFEDINNLLVHK